jgi:hypothetical protein
MHVDQTGTNAFFGEYPGCGHGFGQEGNGCDDGNVAVIFHDNPLAETDLLLLQISLIVRRLTPIALANCSWVTASGSINSLMSISPTHTGRRLVSIILSPHL